LKEKNRRFVFFINPRARFGSAAKRFEGLLARFPELALRAETIVVHSWEDMRRPLAALLGVTGRFARSLTSSLSRRYIPGDG